MSEEPLRVTATPEGLVFTVHVQPRASRCEICGPKDGELKLRLTSPPVDDAANKQCVELIAKTLGVAKSRVSIKSGAKSRHKVVRVEGVLQDELFSLLKL
ncbi:MAG TPA: YggU family protein [Geobacter sp.]|nr:YggU family protein [Geobacter sp.]